MTMAAPTFRVGLCQGSGTQTGGIEAPALADVGGVRSYDLGNLQPDNLYVCSSFQCRHPRTSAEALGDTTADHICDRSALGRT